MTVPLAMLLRREAVLPQRRGQSFTRSLVASSPLIPPLPFD
jgi:hypothetical protein